MGAEADLEIAQGAFEVADSARNAAAEKAAEARAAAEASQAQAAKAEAAERERVRCEQEQATARAVYEHTREQAQQRVASADGAAAAEGAPPTSAARPSMALGGDDDLLSVQSVSASDHTASYEKYQYPE